MEDEIFNTEHSKVKRTMKKGSENISIEIVFIHAQSNRQDSHNTEIGKSDESLRRQ